MEEYRAAGAPAAPTPRSRARSFSAHDDVAGRARGGVNGGGGGRRHRPRRCPKAHSLAKPLLLPFGPTPAPAPPTPTPSCPLSLAAPTKPGALAAPPAAIMAARTHRHEADTAGDPGKIGTVEAEQARARALGALGFTREPGVGWWWRRGGSPTEGNRAGMRDAAKAPRQRRRCKGAAEAGGAGGRRGCALARPSRSLPPGRPSAGPPLPAPSPSARWRTCSPPATRAVCPKGRRRWVQYWARRGAPAGGGRRLVGLADAGGVGGARSACGL